MAQNFQPQPCNQDVFKNGTCIGLIYNYPSPQIEAFVRYAAQLSDTQMDWHFAGGRGRILVLGDEEACQRAYNAILDLRLDPFNTDITNIEITPEMHRRHLNSLI